MENISNKPAVAQPPEQYDAITALPATERGPWVATSRGGMWSIMNPHPRDVFIDDIAWGIARQCRYGGQIRSDLEMYSVAEHACTMTWWAIKDDRIEYLEDALAILLHDGSEAIFGDMATPIKQLLPEYRVMEDRCQAVITHAFGLTPENTLITKAELKEIDNRIRVDERQQIIAEPAQSLGLKLTWERDPELQRLGIETECMLPRQARTAFLSCFTWCCENMPLRDPSIAHVIHSQLMNMEEQIPASRPAQKDDANEISYQDADYGMGFS